MQNNNKEKQIFLKSYEEHIGLFIGYKLLKEGILIVFDKNEYTIIPKNYIDNKNLDTMIDQQIGILNFEGKYLFRIINQKNDKKELENDYNEKRKEIIDFLKNMKA